MSPALADGLHGDRPTRRRRSPAPVFVVTSRPAPARTVGEARTIQQYLAAGLVDELSLHLAPVLLGGGVRLFEELGVPLPRFEQLRVRESPHAVHLRYRVL